MPRAAGFDDIAFFYLAHDAFQEGDGVFQHGFHFAVGAVMRLDVEFFGDAERARVIGFAEGHSHDFFLF